VFPVAWRVLINRGIRQTGDMPTVWTLTRSIKKKCLRKATKPQWMEASSREEGRDKGIHPRD
jgi:hypothetical protein